MSKKHKEWEPITDKWDLEDESLDFLHLYHTGKTDKSKIRIDVVMTDEDEIAACGAFPQQSSVIRKIKRQRWRTWESICYAMNWAKGEPPLLGLKPRRESVGKEEE